MKALSLTLCLFPLRVLHRLFHYLLSILMDDEVPIELNAPSENTYTQLRLELVGNRVLTFENNVFRRTDEGSKIIIECLNHRKAKITIQMLGDEDESGDTEVVFEEENPNTNESIHHEQDPNTTEPLHHEESPITNIPLHHVESPTISIHLHNEESPTISIHLHNEESPTISIHLHNEESPVINTPLHHEDTQNSNINEHPRGSRVQQGNINVHPEGLRVQLARTSKTKAQATLKELAKKDKGTKSSSRLAIRRLVRETNFKHRSKSSNTRQPMSSPFTRPSRNNVGPSRQQEFSPFTGRSHTLGGRESNDTQNNEGPPLHSESSPTGSSTPMEKSSGSEILSMNVLQLGLEFLSFYVVYIQSLGLPRPGDVVSFGGLISGFREFLLATPGPHMQQLLELMDALGPEALQEMLITDLGLILYRYGMGVNVAEGDLHFSSLR